MSPLAAMLAVDAATADEIEDMMFAEKSCRLREISDRFGVPLDIPARAWEAARIFPPAKLAARYAREDEERRRQAAAREKLERRRAEMLAEVEAREAKRRAEEHRTLSIVGEHYSLPDVYRCCRALHAAPRSNVGRRLAAYRTALGVARLQVPSALDRLVVAIASHWERRPTRTEEANAIRSAVVKRIREAVKAAYADCGYRRSLSATADETLRVTVGGPAAVQFASGSKVTGATRRGVIYESHMFYTTTITVPWSWYRRVFQVLDRHPVHNGELVLDLQPTADPRLYTATVVAQARGLRVFARTITIRRATRFDRDIEPCERRSVRSPRRKGIRYDRDVLPDE